jgi:hypothetical protein
MANDIDALIPKIIGKGALVLREEAVMPRLVNTDYSEDAKQKGAVIDVSISPPKTVSAVTAAAVPPTPADTELEKVSITLDKHYKANFHLTAAEEAKTMNVPGFISSQMDQCFRAVANQVNSDLFALYTNVYGYTGTAGTVPFLTTTIAATDARKQLNKQLAPKGNRSFVMSPDAEANALNLAAFQYVANSGDSSVSREGEIGRRLGFDFQATTSVPTHTSTPLTAGACTVNGVQAAGVGSTDGGRTGTLSIAKATNASPLVAGDVFTITGFTQTYTVVTAVSLIVGNTTVTISPALQTATAGGEVIVLKATHIVNLAFNREAFALAIRPEEILPDSMPAGTKSSSYVDPVSGMAFRIDQIPGYRQKTFEVSVLYGVQCVLPQCAVRVAE